MKFFDYKGGVLVRRVFGCPIISKNDVMTLLICGLPILQKSFSYLPYSTGGGGVEL